MYKKLLLLLPLYFGFGCCTDIKDFYNITEFEVRITDTALQPLLVNTITADSIVLVTNYGYEYVEASSSSFSLFMNSAYAFSCEDQGQQGMKDRLMELVVTSDNEFNSIPANEPLNDFIEEMGSGISLTDFAADFATRPHDFFSEMNLVITEKPSQAEHQFTLTMVFESGLTLESQTGRLVWN